MRHCDNVNNNHIGRDGNKCYPNVDNKEGNQEVVVMTAILYIKHKRLWRRTREIQLQEFFNIAHSVSDGLVESYKAIYTEQ